MRYELNFDEDKVNDVLVVGGASYDLKGCCELLNEQQNTISRLKKENEQLRLELETHKHPLWSTREAEKKVNKLADSLADEVNKNGLLNEEINQLRIENMRLKKKGGDGDELSH